MYVMELVTHSGCVSAGVPRIGSVSTAIQASEYEWIRSFSIKLLIRFIIIFFKSRSTSKNVHRSTYVENKCFRELQYNYSASSRVTVYLSSFEMKQLSRDFRLLVQPRVSFRPTARERKPKQHALGWTFRRRLLQTSSLQVFCWQEFENAWPQWSEIKLHRWTRVSFGSPLYVAPVK